MDDDSEKKTSYNYRLLAAVDQSVAAGRDFVVGKGWAPLVNVGLAELRNVANRQRERLLCLLCQELVSAGFECLHQNKSMSLDLAGD